MSNKFTLYIERERDELPSLITWMEIVEIAKYFYDNCGLNEPLVVIESTYKFDSEHDYFSMIGKIEIINTTVITEDGNRQIVKCMADAQHLFSTSIKGVVG